MDDEEGRGSRGFEPFAPTEHLHEVRTADQSAGVAQEADEDRPPPEVGQADDSSREIRQLERRRRIADGRGVHATRPPASAVRIQSLGGSPAMPSLLR